MSQLPHLPEAEPVESQPHYIATPSGSLRFWRAGSGPHLVVLPGLLRSTAVVARTLAQAFPGGTACTRGRASGPSAVRQGMAGVARLPCGAPQFRRCRKEPVLVLPAASRRRAASGIQAGPVPHFFASGGRRARAETSAGGRA